MLATEILRSDNKEISKMEACQLVGQVSAGHKRLTLDQAQNTIERLIQARWMKVRVVRSKGQNFMYVF